MRKYDLLLVIAVFCAVISGIIFYYNNVAIPGISRDVERKVRMDVDVNSMPKTKAAVVTDKGGISKYTVINDEIINTKIKILDIPVKYTAENAVSDVGLLKGRIAKEDLRYGEQVVQDSLSTEKKWFGEYDRLKEYRVSNIVAGEVKSGNIIDVMVTYNNGEYDVVVPKTKVRKLADENGNSDTKGKVNDEKNPEHTIIIAVDEEQYRDLELAKKIGRLETRLYLDESQPQSARTFKYTDSQNKSRIK